MVMSPQVSWLFFKAGRASNAEKQPTGRGPEGCVENGPARETYRRIGVSACRRLQSAINFVETSRSIVATSKSSLASPDADTPIRRPADTLPRPTAHFERNDTTIICETVHKPAKNHVKAEATNS